MTWQAIIREAARTRFDKTGLCDPFLLVAKDLAALAREVSSLDMKFGGADFVRVQVRVYVPEINMQIVVDEWEKG